MAGGEEPVRRLVVREPVFGGDRLLEERDRVCAALFGCGDARRDDRPHHTQHVPQRVESRRGIRRNRDVELLQGGQRAAGLIDPATRGERHAAAIEITGRETAGPRIRRQLRDHLLPQSEAHQRRVLLGETPARVAHGEHHVEGDGLRHALHRGEGLRLASLHGRREGEERVVVSEIHAVVVRRRGGAQVRLIGRHAAAVRLGCLLVTPEALHDVRRHVLQMPRRGHHAGQPCGAGQRLAGIGRGLHDVNVVVIGARVAGAALQHRLEPLLDLQRSCDRLTIRGPQLPGMHVHLALRAQGLHVQIIREALGHAAHGRGVGAEDGVGLRGCRRLRRRIARRERADERLLDGGSPRRALLCLVQRLPGDACARLGQRRNVVVRSYGERHTPVARGACRIELRGAGKGAGRLVVIERPQEAHALIEVLLCERHRGRHRAVKITQSLEQGRPASPLRNACGHAGRGVVVARRRVRVRSTHQHHRRRDHRERACALHGQSLQPLPEAARRSSRGAGRQRAPCVGARRRMVCTTRASPACCPQYIGPPL